MTRSHKRNNHIYLVKNINAKPGDYWYGIFVALKADDAKRYAVNMLWSAGVAPVPWSKALFDSLEVIDAGITKELASNEPVRRFFKQPDIIEETYRSITDEIQKILYVPANRRKGSKPVEQLPDQINLFEESEV